MLRNYLRIFLVSLFCVNAFSWGYQGHALIGEIAYEALQPSQQKCLSLYSEVFYAQLSKKFQEKLHPYYRNAEIFAVLNTLPDAWRDKTLDKLFHQFGAVIPPVLEPYRDETTKNWHFFDKSYPKNCSIPNSTNAAKMLNLLQTAWNNTDNVHTRALLLVLIAHIVGDLHQPLHTLSHADKQCRIDYGGNTYFVITASGKRSLHGLWDGGLGYFDRRMDYKLRAHQLMQQSSPDKNNDSYEWVSQNFQYAEFIYSIVQYHKITEDYYQKGQKIVQQQIARAGYRLADILKTLCR